MKLDLVADVSKEFKWVKRWCIVDRFDMFFCLSFVDFRKALIKFHSLSKCSNIRRYRIQNMYVGEFL